eukprot:m51a1_g767 putativa actin (883) ;mRNA; r:568235-571326
MASSSEDESSSSPASSDDERRGSSRAKASPPSPSSSSASSDPSEGAGSSDTVSSDSSDQSDSPAAVRRRARRARRRQEQIKRRERRKQKTDAIEAQRKADEKKKADAEGGVTIGGQKFALNELGVGNSSLLKWVIDQDKYQPTDEEAKKLAATAAAVSDPVPEPEPEPESPPPARQTTTEKRYPRTSATTSGPIGSRAVSGGPRSRPAKKKTKMEIFKDGATKLGAAASARIAEAKEYGAEKLEDAKFYGSEKLAVAKEHASEKLADTKVRLSDFAETAADKASAMRKAGALQMYKLGTEARRLPRTLHRTSGPAPPQSKTGVPKRQPRPAPAAEVAAAAPGTAPAPEPEVKVTRKNRQREFIGGGIVEQVPEITAPPKRPVPSRPPPAAPSAPKPAIPKKPPPAVPTAPKPAFPSKTPPAIPTSPKPAVPGKAPPAVPSPKVEPAKPAATVVVAEKAVQSPPPAENDELERITKNLGKSATAEDVLTRPTKSTLRRVQSVRPAINVVRQVNAPKRTTKISSDAIIVLDNGSSFLKIGVAGEDIPRSIIPTFSGYVGQSCIIGRPALLKDGLKISCPIDPRKDTNWDALADMWDYLITQELRTDPTEHPLLITEVPMMCESARAKMAEILFEEFEIPALNIASPAVLSLYSQGMSTGVAVDCGNRLQIVPVVDGFAIDAATAKSRHGFANLTEHLSRLLTGRGYYFRTAREMELVRKIKEDTCYVALDYEKEMEKRVNEVEMNYRLTAEREITVGQERFQCPEAMFKPEMLGMDMQGIHRTLWKSVQSCPIDTRKALLSNIVLAGGSTLFPGFEERLESEVFKIAQETKAGLRRSDVRIVAPKNRKYLTWFGGSVLASLPDFVETSCLTADQYFEEGMPGSQ